MLKGGFTDLDIDTKILCISILFALYATLENSKQKHHAYFFEIFNYLLIMLLLKIDKQDHILLVIIAGSNQLNKNL